MKVIYKFTLGNPASYISMPNGAKILCVQMQHGMLCLWAIVDTSKPSTATRKIYVFGTGNELPDLPLEYIGTVQDYEYVWHVFENTSVHLL
jgi:hypothetical protein